jgi:hypothetical protein
MFGVLGGGRVCGGDTEEVLRMNIAFGILILGVVGFFLVKILRTHFYYNRLNRQHQAEWDDINERGRSDDPDIRKRAAEDFVAKLERGPDTLGNGWARRIQ